ncbi:hypothetical protein EYF80_053565 [Liparis tanakae]|uniref:Uncharacterized protein n=1 Tax=Liparis tanakae TaxID=230148 RepID=A0A4Z2F4X7_9TELE|nr:hypothetical protein EYF80_053565 [Liparis tanakae]
MRQETGNFNRSGHLDVRRGTASSSQRRRGAAVGFQELQDIRWISRKNPHQQNPQQQFSRGLGSPHHHPVQENLVVLNLVVLLDRMMVRSSRTSRFPQSLTGSVDRCRSPVTYLLTQRRRVG